MLLIIFIVFYMKLRVKGFYEVYIYLHIKKYSIQNIGYVGRNTVPLCNRSSKDMVSLYAMYI